MPAAGTTIAALTAPAPVTRGSPNADDIDALDKLVLHITLTRRPTTTAHISLRLSAAARSQPSRPAWPILLTPFQRGWWLTVYLLLVGALSQVLLSRGQCALTARPGEPPRTLLWTQWALWNTGTATVAAAEMAQATAGVLLGSVALLVALGRFLAGARRATTGPRYHDAALELSCLTLVVLLGGSVVLGTWLAGALSGQ